MRFKYTTIDPSQDEFDSLPRVALILRREGRTAEAVGLVDSGATVNVLPYDLGLQLGEVWDDRKASLRLSGSLGNRLGIPVFAVAEIGDLPAVTLAFAWTTMSRIPLILGQTNFFMEFDISFYRSKLEFEINPKGSEHVS
ncbi:MAG: hypothetical protein GXY83_20080 [Rhodopirellula sp.]|nr:hypothetical protein [Rhodopirellula sp.]